MKKAQGKTVRQIRLDAKMTSSREGEKSSCGRGEEEGADEIMMKTFRKWTWKPEDGRFVITIRYGEEQSEGTKFQSLRNALEETLKWIKGLTF